MRRDVSHDPQRLRRIRGTGVRGTAAGHDESRRDKGCDRGDQASKHDESIPHSALMAGFGCRQHGTASEAGSTNDIPESLDPSGERSEPCRQAGIRRQHMGIIMTAFAAEMS
ncbi:hypothetical protein [Propioniciclava coleopterorum]|uniref:hypothetical protein n=1 Tax=Propioniciclava coleopterorum TaxID=2714937 RepID=UPI00197CDD8F|nr:hypothetical protein [Propioniciclava coleopterorum]